MREIFKPAMQFTVGNGKCTSFWRDKWRGTHCLADIVTDVYNVTDIKERTVQDMYCRGRFCVPIEHGTDSHTRKSYTRLLRDLDGCQLNQESEDIP